MAIAWMIEELGSALKPTDESERWGLGEARERIIHAIALAIALIESLPGLVTGLRTHDHAEYSRDAHPRLTETVA
jgi:hypothetical protein